jgi:hypothetical protein
MAGGQAAIVVQRNASGLPRVPGPLGATPEQGDEW